MQDIQRIWDKMARALAGTCAIQETQAGNATYVAATPITQSFTVNTSSGGDPTVGVVPSYNDAYASVGGIPNRTTVCTTVKPLGGGQDDFNNIQFREISYLASGSPLAQGIPLSCANQRGSGCGTGEVQRRSAVQRRGEIRRDR